MKKPILPLRLTEVFDRGGRILKEDVAQLKVIVERTKRNYSGMSTQALQREVRRAEDLYEVIEIHLSLIEDAETYCSPAEREKERARIMRLWNARTRKFEAKRGSKEIRC